MRYTKLVLLLVLLAYQYMIFHWSREQRRRANERINEIQKILADWTAYEQEVKTLKSTGEVCVTYGDRPEAPGIIEHHKPKHYDYGPSPYPGERRLAGDVCEDEDFHIPGQHGMLFVESSK